MSKAAFLILGILIGFCAALGISGRAETWLVGSGIAIHGDRSHHYNWLTTGIGLEQTFTDTLRGAAGVYRNSNYNDSSYGAFIYMPFIAGALKAGIFAGGATGYRAPVTPVAGFAAAYEGKKYGMNLILVPPSGDSGKGVAWFQWKVRW